MNQQTSPGRSSPPFAISPRTRKSVERRIDDELEQSFPASDPPSWVSGVIDPEMPRAEPLDRRSS